MKDQKLLATSRELQEIGHVPLGHEPQRGFTLVELLVSIAILLLAISGTLFVTSRGILIAQIARDQVAAFYLAQEAIEYVRGLRDSNALAGTPWLSGFNGAGGPNCIANSCIVDARNESITQCGGAHATCSSLLVAAGSGIYNHVSGSASVFKRSLRVTEVVADREAVVETTVSWTDRSNSYSYTTQTRLMNWQ